MSGEIDIFRLWSIVQASPACMLVSVDGPRMRARPMSPIAAPGEKAIWFFTDRRSHKKEEIEAEPRVCLTLEIPDESLYLSISGIAAVIADEAMLAAKWNDEARTWFPDGPTDPNVRLLRVSPEIAEYWSRPYDLATVRRKLAHAQETGEQPDLGVHARIAL